MLTLVVTTKSGRHRKDHEFPCDEHHADSPVFRAQAVSLATASLTDRVVNWRFEDRDR